MNESNEEFGVLDHVNVISDTIFVLGFLEEAFMTFDSFTRQGGVGMEIIVSEYKRKLKRSRDYLLNYIQRIQQGACSPACPVPQPVPCGEPVTMERM